MLHGLTGSASCARQLTPGLRGTPPTSRPPLAPASGLAGREIAAGLRAHGPGLMGTDAMSGPAKGSKSSCWTRAGLLDAGLDLVRQCSGLMGRLRKSSDARARWLELRNKIAAYRLFSACARAGHEMGKAPIDELTSYSRFFAEEGHAYRNARAGMLPPDMPPEFSPIATHAGAGLWLAEQALEIIEAGSCEDEILGEFAAICRRAAFEGFAGIMEEALGLVARTLYPHLMERLDQRLGAMNAECLGRFWHGAGRGIYFAPCNIPPFRAAPWSGIGMCLREPPQEAGKHHALSGFCFALTLVNLQHPEVLEAFFKHHARHTADCVDGLQAAIAVWTLSGGESEGTDWLAPHCPSPHRARLFLARLWPCEVVAEDRRRPERLFSARLRRQ
jgi:hypothetical protein